MFALIDNPASGASARGELIARICAELSRRGETVQRFETQCPGDGEHQARQALHAGCTGIISVGGDGSLSDVVRALANSDALRKQYAEFDTIQRLPCRLKIRGCKSNLGGAFHRQGVQQLVMDKYMRLRDFFVYRKNSSPSI